MFTPAVTGILGTIMTVLPSAVTAYVKLASDLLLTALSETDLIARSPKAVALANTIGACS
jgi:hypothetical protein